MECRHIHTFIHESLSGTLSDEERGILDRHLSHCRACQTDYAVLCAVVRAVEKTPPLQPSADFTLKVMDRLPTPMLIFGRVPLAVFRVMMGVLGLCAGTVTWFYRSAIARLFQGMSDITTETNSVASSFQIAITAIRAILSAISQSIPVPLEPHRLEPAFSVLIAIGIAYVVLKMVEGFQSTEFDTAPDESYS